MTTQHQVQGARVLVLICEQALETLIGRELLECGAPGYTLGEVRGRGHRGVRDAQLSLSGNVRFEVVCTAPVAECIVERVRSKYARHFGVLIYTFDAEVPLYQSD